MTRIRVHLVTGDTVMSHTTADATIAELLTKNYIKDGAFRVNRHVFPWQSVNWIEVEDDQ